MISLLLLLLLFLFGITNPVHGFVLLLLILLAGMLLFGVNMGT